MSVRPRGALPQWQPSTARQTGILADVLAAYRAHHAAATGGLIFTRLALTEDQAHDLDLLADAIRTALFAEQRP